MKAKVLNIKDFVLAIVLSCLMIGIGYLIMLPFAANMQLLYFLEPGLIGLVNGIVYVLMIRKCPKIGTQFIIAALYGTYMLIMGSAYAALYFYILAVVNELIMLGGGLSKQGAPCHSPCSHVVPERNGQHSQLVPVQRKLCQDLYGFRHGRSHGNSFCKSDGGILVCTAEYPDFSVCNSSPLCWRLSAWRQNVGQAF